MGTSVKASEAWLEINIHGEGGRGGRVYWQGHDEMKTGNAGTFSLYPATSLSHKTWRLIPLTLPPSLPPSPSPLPPSFHSHGSGQDEEAPATTT